MANPYITRCNTCGANTSIKYARANQGKCKSCAEPESQAAQRRAEQRNARIIDAGWDAYAREEGHYDIPDSW